MVIVMIVRLLIEQLRIDQYPPGLAGSRGRATVTGSGRLRRSVPCPWPCSFPRRNRQRKSHRRRLRKLHKDIVALTGDHPGTTWHKIGLRANVHWDASQYPDGRPNESAIAYFERKDMLPQIIKEAEAWLAELQRGGRLALN